MINWRGTGLGPREEPLPRTLSSSSLSLLASSRRLDRISSTYRDNRERRDERRPVVKTCREISSEMIERNTYNIPSTAFSIRPERIPRLLLSLEVSLVRLWYRRKGGRGRFGRSFPSTIIPENSYLSSRPASREPSILTIVRYSRAGKSSPPSDSTGARPWLRIRIRADDSSSFFSPPSLPPFLKLQKGGEKGKREKEARNRRGEEKCRLLRASEQQHAIVSFLFAFSSRVSRRKNSTR